MQKSMNLKYEPASEQGDPHPLGLDYEGTWEADDTRLVCSLG